jgi:hypothetical protein
MTRANQTLERRIFSRQAMAFRVTVEAARRQAETGPAPEKLTGLTRDVSNRGAYFWAEGAFHTGQQLRVSLEIPPEQGRNYSLKIQWEAEVIRVEGNQLGRPALGVAVRILHFETPKIAPGLET